MYYHTLPMCLVLYITPCTSNFFVQRFFGFAILHIKGALRPVQIMTFYMVAYRTTCNKFVCTFKERENSVKERRDDELKHAKKKSEKKELKEEKIKESENRMTEKRTQKTE